MSFTTHPKEKNRAVGWSGWSGRRSSVLLGWSMASVVELHEAVERAEARAERLQLRLEGLERVVDVLEVRVHLGARAWWVARGACVREPRR